MKLSVTDIINTSHAHCRISGKATHFTSISTDSRQVRKGSLFVALQGPSFDGHHYVREAMRKGAVGAIIRKGRRIQAQKSRWLLVVNDPLTALGDIAASWRATMPATAIAITGSNGKTTTKELLAHILMAHHPTLKTEGNYNNLIGLPLTLFRMNRRHRYAVLELGMNALGEIDRLSAIAQPTIGVITNIGRAHLEGVGSLAAVARAKGELLPHLPRDGFAILNADDPATKKLIKKTKATVRTFGFSANAWVRATQIIDRGLKGSRFTVKQGQQKAVISLPIPGRCHISNALAAIAVALSLDIPLRSIARVLKTVSLPQGRLEKIQLHNGILLLNDSYNANPESTRQAIDIVRTTTTKHRKILVLGDMLEMGKQARKVHREIGEIAGKSNPHLLIAVGDHATDIIGGAKKTRLSVKKMIESPTAHAAGTVLQQLVQAGDLILLKGSRKVGLETIITKLRKAA